MFQYRFIIVYCGAPVLRMRGAVTNDMVWYDMMHVRRQLSILSTACGQSYAEELRQQYKAAVRQQKQLPRQQQQQQQAAASVCDDDDDDQSNTTTSTSTPTTSVVTGLCWRCRGPLLPRRRCRCHRPLPVPSRAAAVSVVSPRTTPTSRASAGAAAAVLDHRGMMRRYRLADS